MKYKIIKRNGYFNEDVYECQDNMNGYFDTMYMRTGKNSWYSKWCGNDVKPAIFKTEAEAKAFIASVKADPSKRAVFKMSKVI